MRSSRLLQLIALPLLSRITTAQFFNFGSSNAEWPDETNDTVFNGKTVPRPTYLKADTFDDTIKDGNWVVEFFSPYCHHCQAFAPVWKTLVEFYYTQDPVPQASSNTDDDASGESGEGDEGSLNDFTHFYDFHFAKVDCVAQADLCGKKEVRSFPTVRFYRNGESQKEILGQRDLKTMSQSVEEVLESIRPGSRPQGGPALPEVGASQAEAVAANIPADIASPTTTTAKDEGGKATSTLVATRIPTPQANLPNPLGKSQPLSAESFQRLVTMTRDPWFIKFHTPWCKHCQSLTPNWQGMARQMQNRLNIGEVNCEIEKRLCKDVKIRGYPTVIFFRGSERIEYSGLRGLGDLIAYGNQAVKACQGVDEVTLEQFEALEEKEEVIFIYFHDLATTSEDFAALEKLPLSLIGHAKLVKSGDPALAAKFSISTWPRFAVSRDGQKTYYQPISPHDMRDHRRVLGWMQRNWLPIVPELTAGNAHEIMDGKIVVLGILDRRNNDAFVGAKREMVNAAHEWLDKQSAKFKLELQELRDSKELRLEEAEDRNDQRALRSAKAIRISPEDILREQGKVVGFAWVDGVFWERWIKTTFGITLAKGEKVVVNDEDAHAYWDVTVTSNPIIPSRTSILETLKAIKAGRLSSKTKLTVVGHLWWVVRGHILQHPFVSAGLGVVLVIGMWWFSRSVVWRSAERGVGYFRVGEKGGPMDGILGGSNGNGHGYGHGHGNAGVGKKD